jgi:HAE1 family hydrophobic/amphiphilic exporter-1
MGDEEVLVVVDRLRARQYGFSSEQVARSVTVAMRGQNLRRFRTAEGEVEMHLRFQDSDRRSLDDLRNLPIYGPQDRPVKLASLAHLNVRRGPQSIRREERRTMMGITAHTDGIPDAEAREKITQILNRYQLPAGYAWSFGQSWQGEQESQNIMLMNLLLALALIYLVMAALFESLIYPAAIWSSIIFAVVGVFWFFFATGTAFSVMAWIGVLILIGVVVNNGIVLIDHINYLRASGLSRTEAIVQGGRDRLRPILMTALTTILGLIPLCIGTTQIGGDGPPYYPMARAIVGGLAFSTVVTLIMLPTIYVVLDDLRNWGRRTVRASTMQ